MSVPIANIMEPADWQDREMERLEAENARLRADAAHWELANCPGCVNVADLQEALEENAKLRELAKHLYICVRNVACDACEYAADDCDFEYELRELGVPL